MTNKISFPGIGIEEFEIDRIAFTIFGKDVAWYGVIIAIAMLVAVGYVMWRTKDYKGITPDDIIDYALFLIVFGVIGARLYYVIFDPTPNYDSFIDVIAIWRGGLAIYGGIIAGAAAAIVVSLVKKIRIPCFFDMLAPAVMIAQAIGRWGNFVNAEAHGGVTDFFLRMEINGVPVHPTFLYESIWNLLGFILLNIFYRKRKFDGQIVLGYLAWYGLGRGFIEGLRTDSLYIGPLRVSQLVGFISFAVATVVMIYFWFIRRAPRSEMARYGEKTVALNAAEAAENAETPTAGAIETACYSEDISQTNDKKADGNKVTNEGDSENGDDN